MTATIRKFLADQSGATAIEYALIGTLIAVAIVGAFATLGNSMITLFDTTAAETIANQTATLS